MRMNVVEDSRLTVLDLDAAEIGRLASGTSLWVASSDGREVVLVRLLEENKKPQNGPPLKFSDWRGEDGTVFREEMRDAGLGSMMDAAMGWHLFHKYPSRSAIARATDTELLQIEGVGPITLKKLREHIPHEETG